MEAFILFFFSFFRFFVVLSEACTRRGIYRRRRSVCVSHPLGGGLSSIARQPRECQYRTSNLVSSKGGSSEFEPPRRDSFLVQKKIDAESA